MYTGTSSLNQVASKYPGTPTRSIRIPEELWRACLRKAQDEGTTVTEIVIRALQRFLRD